MVPVCQSRHVPMKSKKTALMSLGVGVVILFYFVSRGGGG